jgi:predicted dinucleotide-binding enzyme
VRVSNSRDPETLADLAAETGATAVWAKDAPVDADLVIVSIPQKNTPDLAEGIVSTRKPDAPVIETNNYYPQQRDGRIDAIEEGTPESVWVAEQLDAPVFKVFNGIFWKHLLENGVPRGTAGRIALPIAGDDPAGKQIVSDLVDSIGFDPVDAGTLAESWRQQPDTPVYGTDLDAAGAKKALAEASAERPEGFRLAA